MQSDCGLRKSIFHCVKLTRNYLNFFFGFLTLPPWERYRIKFAILFIYSWTVYNMSPVSRMLTSVWVRQKVREKKPFRPRRLCAHTKIYCFPENNGIAELVQEDFSSSFPNLLMSYSYIIAGWERTNNIPPNTWQQYVMVVKKFTRSGEKLIYGNLLLFGHLTPKSLTS